MQKAERKNTARKGHDGHKEQGEIRETIKIIFQALILAILIRTFLFQPFNIPSGSMKSTMLIGDYLFVSKYSYGYSRHSLPFSPPLFSGRIFASRPQRGDVAVFKNPFTGEDWIKRVIGLPGDEIQMIDGVLYINGKAVPKRRVRDFIERDQYGNIHVTPRYRETLPNGVSYNVLDAMPNGPWDTTRVYRVPPGHYFMMGDNRDNSADSRTPMLGPVPFENFVGKARWRFFSVRPEGRWYKFWRWPSDIRFSRIFTTIK